MYDICMTINLFLHKAQECEVICKRNPEEKPEISERKTNKNEHAARFISTSNQHRTV